MYLQAYTSRVRARMCSSVGRMHMTHLGCEKSEFSDEATVLCSDVFIDDGEKG